MNATVVPAEHYHPPLRIRGQVYDLSHLHPFQFDVSSSKVPRRLRINVRFTNHCFSEAFDPAKHPADEPVIPDGQRRRAFCPDRYDLSPRLPSLIRGLADPGSARPRDRRPSELDVCCPRRGAVRGHAIPDLLRAAAHRPRATALQDLDMVVESAYPADPSRTEPNILGPVRFALLAGSLYLGKVVTTRR